MVTALADWVLAQLRVAMPDETIYDAARTTTSFDGLTIEDDSRFVMLFCPRPAAVQVTIGHRDNALADATFTIHSVGRTRNECEWRQKRVSTLRDRVPAVEGYEFGLIEHQISRLETPDYSAPDRVQILAVDQFRVSGFEVPQP